MPAYFDTGFSVRVPMWHGEGMVLDDYPVDWADARVKADLLWEPAAAPLFACTSGCPGCGIVPGEQHHDGCEHGDGVLLGEASYERIGSHKRIVRDDTGVTLGVVGHDYTLVSHSAMGEILEAILGQTNVKFETAGSCKGGAVVWALAYLDEPREVAGDDTATYPFVALIDVHDGTGACKLVETDVRIVCWNTMQAASLQGEASGRQFTFRHTKGVMDRIDEAKAALAGVREQSKEWDALAADLYSLAADERSLGLFLSEFIPEPEADVISTRVRNNIDRGREWFRQLYLESPTTEAHRGTALGLVDASIEYLDHVRGYRNRDTYLGRTLLRPEPLKAKAVQLARRVCA